MPAEYLLDTNVAIALLNGRLNLDHLAGAEARLFLCPAVVAELIFGALKSERAAANRRRIDELIATLPVLSCNEETAAQFATIRDRLRRRGKPIPINDQWIAASALEHGLILATRDGHFDEVEGLKIDSW